MLSSGTPLVRSAFQTASWWRQNRPLQRGCWHEHSRRVVTWRSPVSSGSLAPTSICSANAGTGSRSAIDASVQSCSGS
jgi:hypothetical protein